MDTAGGEANEEEAFLAARLADIESSGVPFLTDQDARGNDRAHPLANLWDNGADPVAMLRHESRVRRTALERFSAAAIPAGETMSSLEHVLVPLYFHHRYQLEAAVRQLGGVSYRHGVRGGAPSQLTPVPAETQQDALAAVLDTLTREFLELPTAVLDLIPPRAPGDDNAAERFDNSDLLLDGEGIAAAGIRMTLELLLDPVRAERMIDQQVRNTDMPGFDAVCEALMVQGWARSGEDHGALRAQVLERWMDLAVRADVSVRVQRVAWKSLSEIRRLYADGVVPMITIEERRQAIWETVRLEAFFLDPRAPRTPLRLSPNPARVPHRLRRRGRTRLLNQAVRT